MPIVQRRSKPVNGSVLAFSLEGDVLLLGLVLVVGAVSFFSGVVVSLELAAGLGASLSSL